MTERYVTAQELAELMGVSVKTIYRLRRAGMPSESWGMARTRRYLPSKAIAWVLEQESTPDKMAGERLRLVQEHRPGAKRNQTEVT